MQRTLNISDKTLNHCRTIQRKYYNLGYVFYKITYYAVYGTGRKLYEKRYNRLDEWVAVKGVDFINFIV